MFMDLNKKTETENEGGSEPQKTNPGDDINTSLGKFGNNDPAADPEFVTPDPTLAAQAIEQENFEEKKEKKFKIDFERFNRRKQVASNNPFNLKVDAWLRGKKSFLIIWLVILAVIVTVLVTQITLPIFVSKIINNPAHDVYFLKNTGKASVILSYISLGLIPLPFLFLLTTWIIGVNGVARSRIFHLTLWFLLTLSLLCAIISIGCGGYVIYDHSTFHSL